MFSAVILWDIKGRGCTVIISEQVAGEWCDQEAERFRSTVDDVKIGNDGILRIEDGSGREWPCYNVRLGWNVKGIQSLATIWEVEA